MRRFTHLYLELDATTSTTEKLDLLEAYFRAAPDADAAWALALLTSKGPRRAASTRVLRSLALELADVPSWLFDECYASVGDLSETVALLLPDDAEASDAGEPLHVTMERHVLPLVGLDDAARRTVIRAAWRTMDADQRFVYHKLMRRGFRVGVQKQLVTRALARVADVDPKAMAQRLVASFDPVPEAYRRVIAREECSERALLPLPFYLASPLDGEVAALGSLDDWHAEWKYDGIRAQVVRRGGAVAIWSRGEELVTHQFPEIVAAAGALTIDAVLDGEILVFDGDTPRPFSTLQKRLNRKMAPPPGLFDTERVVFMAFDALERDGDDQRSRPQAERRELLLEIVDSATDETIRCSPLLGAEDWPELASLRETSRERGVEGMMLKHRLAPYGTGRARSEHGWWKWKVDPYTVDAVLVAAQPGSGRRASLYTDYTFALWDRAVGPDHEERALVTFTKSYSGLRQDEIERLDRWIRAHTVRKAGPFRQVEPVQVFEIAFEQVQASRRHKSGVALRFPRIVRWRHDKAAAEADVLGTLVALVR